MAYLMERQTKPQRDQRVWHAPETVHGPDMHRHRKWREELSGVGQQEEAGAMRCSEIYMSPLRQREAIEGF